jgi:hypothetical protein
MQDAIRSRRNPYNCREYSAMLVSRRKMWLALPVLVVALGSVGCSGQQTNTTQAASATAPSDQTAQQLVQTTQTTTTTNSGHSTLLGATANFVWTVVSFPFRAVGDVIGEIV